MNRARIYSLVATFILLVSCAHYKEISGTHLSPLPSETSQSAPDLTPVPEQEYVITLPAVSPRPVFIEETDSGERITLNFENSDIKTIIDTFSELLNMNYVLSPSISGNVTIQSYNSFPTNELLNIFHIILELNGLTVIERNASYKIVPLDIERFQTREFEKLADLRFRLDGTRITQIIPLRYVKASDAVSLFRNLLPSGTNMMIYKPENILIANARPSSIVKFMKLIEAIDVRDTDAIRTFVYDVEYGEADKLALILRNIYSADNIARTKSVPYQRQSSLSSPEMTEISYTAGNAIYLPDSIGEIAITSYSDINALLIKCSPEVYSSLLDVLRKIDVPVRQVVIEVLIAEITLTDTTDFGVQWLLESGATKAGFTTSSTRKTEFASEEPLFQTLVAGTIDKSYLEGFITALASESRVNVLASPQILTMDNQEAEIIIGSEIPTATGLTQQPAEGGGTTLVSSGQIQYRSIGTILQVTPHVTEAGNVNMKLVVEQSDLGDDIILGSGAFPSFTSRRAATSAVVTSGRTLFLGGLISNEKSISRRGIPILSKIPVLGYLFGINSDSVTKRELLVMVTPRVVEDQLGAQEMTKDFQKRVRTINKRLDELETESIKLLPSRKGPPGLRREKPPEE